MHEAIAQSVVDAVLERTGDRPVGMVRLQVGKLTARTSATCGRACGRAVAWHHGKAAWTVTTNQANLDYARAMGTNSTAYDAPKVFR
jgi:hypothetical protein